MALNTISAAEARNNFSSVLDAAEGGKGTMIIRNSKQTAAIIPPELARLVPLLEAILRDMGESIKMSEDPEVLEAFRRGMDEIAREEIDWYEV